MKSNLRSRKKEFFNIFDAYQGEKFLASKTSGSDQQKQSVFIQKRFKVPKYNI